MKQFHAWRAGSVLCLGLWAGTVLALSTPAASERQVQATTATIVGVPAQTTPAANEPATDATSEARAGVDVSPLTLLLAGVGVGALLWLRRAAAAER